MLMDVIVKGDPQWPILLVTLLSVSLGVALTFFVSVWQRVLDGQAAARLIRAESIANRARVLERAPPDHLSTAAWETHGMKVVPFLGELHLMRIGESYAELARIGLLIEIEARRGESELGDDRIATWVEHEKENGRILRHYVEAARPWKLAPMLLWPRRVATPEEIAQAYSLDGEIPTVRETLAKRREEKSLRAQKGFPTDSAAAPDDTTTA